MLQDMEKKGIPQAMMRNPCHADEACTALLDELSIIQLIPLKQF